MDLQGTPNIGTLMFTPYARIVPMHAIMFIGTSLATGGFSVIVFGVMKTIADVVMHRSEHKTIGARQ